MTSPGRATGPSKRPTEGALTETLLDIRGDLASVVAGARSRLESANAAREMALAGCRVVVRSSSLAIRRIQRRDRAGAMGHLKAAHAALVEVQEALVNEPAVMFGGFVQDAEKEYAEAVLTDALLGGRALAGPDEVGVGVASWLNGLAEAASELRRYLLDGLRGGEADEAERLLEVMENVYEELVTVDLPDALTEGLRRRVDALRAVLERTRADVTTAVMQLRLQATLERALEVKGDG